MVMTINCHRLLGVILILLASACAHRECNNIPHKTEAEKKAVAKEEDEYEKEEDEDHISPSEFVSDPEPDVPVKSSKSTATVSVYKPTGELQCGMGKAIPIKTMSALLKKNKISVIESRTQSDGRMHIAACGTPSGKIHVFKIPKRLQKSAEKMGFKVLNAEAQSP